MLVLDDIRDSTRLSAIGFMKVLSDQVLRACNPIENVGNVVNVQNNTYNAQNSTQNSGQNNVQNNTQNNTKNQVKKQEVEVGTVSVVDDAISFIMPILLDKGLLAPSPEGRGFTLGVLVKLIKSSKSALKQWLIRLVGVLVESMSALEPKTLQYMQFHTARLQINEEEKINKLESIRIFSHLNS